MSPFKRVDGTTYYVDLRYRGFRRVKLSTGTTTKARAEAMEHMLEALKRAGRRDLFELLATRRLTLPDVFAAWEQRGDELEHLKARAESPTLGGLVERWLAWLRSPAGVSTRTRRRYAERTVQQYAVRWEGFFSVLPRAREARLSDLTRGFVLDYRQSRTRATGGKKRVAHPDRPLSGATINRDLAALGAFLTWIRDVEGLRVERPALPRERESSGRERWLSGDDLAAFERACPAEWWPFFAALFFTGARLGEVQGLRGADVILHAKRLTIQEADRRLKTKESVRDLPISEPLERALADHLVRVEAGPSDLVFPGEYQSYAAVRRAWDATCTTAAIAGARPHDARHTFAVHAAQSGVPIVRLQKLLGHATAAMTMRYMKHAPEAYLSKDGAKIAAHMAGTTDAEAAARAAAARAGMKAG